MKVTKQGKKSHWNQRKKTSLDFEIFNYILVYYESYLKIQFQKFPYRKTCRFSHKKETLFSKKEFDSKLSFP